MSSPSKLRARIGAILPLLLTLAACTGPESGYPSLAPRPIESMSLAEPMRPAAAPPVADPSALARYAPVLKQAHADDATFRETLKQERETLERGRNAPRGSDAWTAAQTSLSRVEAARAPVARALSDLDAARSSTPTEENTGQAVAASQAFEQVQALDKAETEALSSLMPPGQ
ncbi:hypothetical protein [Sphingomonas oligoaromativorans]|uniref:hypothetical protein n=1 Tax=Sphingomonas oligoaromativorans TaxID=575322 RepID=UPI00142202A8|nr:hypothetical protein [Sphingomonas oligoaromativorans]NIJ33715.1 type IV secretory pathway VirB10-like protein [Sphingomonas oligoaromativorans]